MIEKSKRNLITALWALEAVDPKDLRDDLTRDWLSHAIGSVKGVLMLLPKDDKCES